MLSLLRLYLRCLITSATLGNRWDDLYLFLCFYSWNPFFNSGLMALRLFYFSFLCAFMVSLCIYPPAQFHSTRLLIDL